MIRPLLEASASLKGFMPRESEDQDPPDSDGPSGRNADVNFHGKKRSNETHVSKADPESRLAKKGKGKEAKLSYCGHLMTENRNGVIVDTEVTTATGTAEREATALMLERRPNKKRNRFELVKQRNSLRGACISAVKLITGVSMSNKSWL